MKNKLKQFLWPKGLSDIFLLIALITTIAGLIGYVLTGITIFQTKLYNSVIVSLSVLLVLEILFLVFNSKMGKYACFVLSIYSLISYIGSQATYLANILVSIDGSTFSAGFILTILALILTFATTLVSAILAKDEQTLLAMEEEKDA